MLQVYYHYVGRAGFEPANSYQLDPDSGWQVLLPTKLPARCRFKESANLVVICQKRYSFSF